MWTQAHRATYKQSGAALPSDLTDAQWQRLEPLIPAAKPGGRPRKTDMRAAMNAIFYLLRTGCPWRYLPRGPFPPRSTVYNIFRQFQRDGAWERIWEELHMALREALGREASPTAAIIDSQSLKVGGKRGAASRGEKDAVGYDAGKKVKGRKLHALVDVEGLPLRVIVHSARHPGSRRRGPGSRQDPPALSMAGARLGRRRLQRPPGQRRRRARSPGLRLEIVKRTDDIERLRRAAPSMGRRANLLMVRPQPTSGQGLREPR